MATEDQRARWKAARIAGASITEAKQRLMFTIEEVQDCEQDMHTHHRKVW